ncbi:MAG: ACP S-malonyltransferase [Vulcanimicrobiota bacterium]
MSKLAFVFPGQGSQTVGMGMDVAEKYPAAEKIFKTADKVLGFSLADMIKNGPEEDLKITVNTQPAIVTTSIALLEVLRGQGFTCNATAGHSIGEYSALYCAGVLTLEDALMLTRARGEYMNEAGEDNPGTLAAIIGVDKEKMEEICHKTASETGETVVVANINCPGQIVISGNHQSVEKAGEMASEAGAKKVIPLAVSAAFHSPLMNKAADKLAKKLNKVTFSDAKIPVYSNVTGTMVTDGDKLRDLMKQQIISQVQWEKSVNMMKSDGIDTFVEIGPGKALAGMIKRIDRKADVHNFNGLAALDRIMKKIGPEMVAI